MESFTASLALIAGVGATGFGLVRLGARRVRLASDIVSAVHSVSLWLAWVVAAAATAGSLYFSEVADFVPCRLCWFQRICMYPLAGILGVAAIRRDRSVRWYALPLVVAGSAVSIYHYVIEWKPSLGDGACSVGPSCTDVWFRSYGFVSLAFMALCGFLSIAALLFVTPPGAGVEPRED